jgi:hypothetical protein
MCDLALPSSVEIVSAKVAAAEIAAHRTTVCGRCERRVEKARGPEPIRQPSRQASTPPRALTPEQQALKYWLDRERSQRAEARRQAGLDKKASPSRSVHTMSGGLPTLGKKKR